MALLFGKHGKQEHVLTGAGGSVEKGGNPEIVRESQRRRFADVSLVDKVIELDQEWRQSKHQPTSLMGGCTYAMVASCSAAQSAQSVCCGAGTCAGLHAGPAELVMPNIVNMLFHAITQLALVPTS